jgi:hypothetical protein
MFALGMLAPGEATPGQGISRGVARHASDDSSRDLHVSSRLGAREQEPGDES